MFAATPPRVYLRRARCRLGRRGEGAGREVHVRDRGAPWRRPEGPAGSEACLLYTSDAADDM
eukprot:8580120-Alexandrium_andersonii.AAC.1